MVLLNLYAMQIPPPYAYDLDRFNNLTNPCPDGQIPILDDASSLWNTGNNCYQTPG